MTKKILKLKKSTSLKSAHALTDSKKASSATPKRSLDSQEISGNFPKSSPTMSMPQQPMTTTAAPEALPIQSVDSILAQSQEQPPKRKRGRPRKTDLSAPPLAREASDPEAGDSASGPILDTPSPQAPPIPKEALAPLISAPFKAAALRTGYLEFNLTDAEVESLVPLADTVIRQYLGESQSPHAPLYTLCGTLFLFAGIRTLGYLQWRRDQIDAWNARAARDESPKPATLPNEARPH